MSQAIALLHEAGQLIDVLTDGYRAGPLSRVACVYAALGETEQAERAVGAARELADAAPDTVMQVGNIVDVARAYARLDQVVPAARESRRAEQLVATIRHSPWAAYTQARVAGMLAVTGAPSRAEQLAQSIGPAEERVTGLLLIAEARPQDARRLVDEAERAGRSITEAAQAVRALTRVAEAMALHGRFIDAGQLAEDTERLAAAAEPDRRPGAYAQVAIAFARADQARRAMPLARQADELAAGVADRGIRLGALQQVVEAYARTGDLERAESRALALTDSFARAAALSRLVDVLADAGDIDRAAALAHAVDEAEPHWRLHSLLTVAEAATTIAGPPANH
jgi:hypothetical protein